MNQKKKTLLRWPGLSKYLSHITLGDWPTKVEQFTQLDNTLSKNIWIKRDDLSSKIYGGNKVRKLEFLLGNQNNTVVTIGALGSHHVLATALHAHSLNKRCIGILVSQPMTPHCKKTFELIKKHCDHIIRIDKPNLNLTKVKKLCQSVFSNSFDTISFTFIPPGASNVAGTLGYVIAGFELANQIKTFQCPAPNEIYVPLGTGGTAAGLALGLALAQVPTKVIAVRVASYFTGNEAYLNYLARRTYKLLKQFGEPNPMPNLLLQVENRYIGQGYGYPTKSGDAALDMVAAGSVKLESTYSAKTLAAMIDQTRKHSSNVIRMFLDTYGSIDDLR